MEKHLNNLLFLFPIMLYYALEAIIVGVFILLVWRLFLSQILGNIGYLQIVSIYWIFKMLFFNVFNLIAGLSTAGSNMQQEMEANKEFDENEIQ